jgi:hypothetical protein
MPAFSKAILFVLLLLGAGCSSTEAPPSNKGFLLSIVSVGVSGTGDLAFRLKVALDGTPVENARLTMLSNPTNKLDTLAVKSTAEGIFNFQVGRNDTVVARAFRSYKDSLLSNYVRYP